MCNPRCTHMCGIGRLNYFNGGFISYLGYRVCVNHVLRLAPWGCDCYNKTYVMHFVVVNIEPITVSSVHLAAFSGDGIQEHRGTQ